MKNNKANDTLTLEEFLAVTMEGFGYLEEAKSWGDVLETIFDTIREEEQLSYKLFLGWVKKELA